MFNGLGAKAFRMSLGLEVQIFVGWVFGFGAKGDRV